MHSPPDDLGFFEPSAGFVWRDDSLRNGC